MVGHLSLCSCRFVEHSSVPSVVRSALGVSEGLQHPWEGVFSVTGPDAVCGALCLPGEPLWSSASSCIVHSTFLGGRAVGLCYYWVFTYFSVRPQTSALLAGTWILIAVTILHERQTSVYQVLVIEGPGRPFQGACE